jgi:chromosome segregation ATPase
VAEESTSMNVTAIRKNGDPRDPTRDGLRQAIAELQKARDVAAERDSAWDRARRHIRDIDGKLAAAATAVEEAREAMADAVAAGEAMPSPTAIRAARAAEADLQDQRQALEASIVRLREGWQAGLSGVERAERQVNSAICGVLEESGHALIKRVREAHVRLVALKGALSVIAGRFEPWSELSKAAERAGNFSDEIGAEARVTQRAWEGAIEALKTDASAPLPDGAGK